MRLNDVPDVELQRAGKALERKQNGTRAWRLLGEEGFPELYSRGGGRKLRELFCQRSRDNGSGIGVALLYDLRREDVTVEHLVDVMLKVGCHDAASCLRMPERPRITRQPEAAPVAAGKPFSLTCQGVGFPTVTYQWFKHPRDGSEVREIAFAVGPRLAFRCAKEEHQNDGYSCKLTNSAGSVSTKTVYILVLPEESRQGSGQDSLVERSESMHIAESSRSLPLSVSLTQEIPLLEVPTIQPREVVCRHGDRPLFQVDVDGDGLLYQWFCNGKELAGETRARLVLAGVTPVNQGTYRCRVSSRRQSLMSHSADLKLSAAHSSQPPQITFEPPPKLIIREGGRLILDLTSADASDHFTWYHGNAPVSWSSCYEKHRLTILDGGEYYCVVRNVQGLQQRSRSTFVEVYAR